MMAKYPSLKRNGNARTFSGKRFASSCKNLIPGNPSSPGIGKKRKHAPLEVDKYFSIAEQAKSYPF